jgi:Xaa-Pro aminopeptidase
MDNALIPVVKGKPPFDSARLDSLMEQAGFDVLLASSRHNLRYMLGGYTFFFFDSFEAFGTSRYFPILLYFRGRPEDTVYVGNGMESFEVELGKFWMAEVSARSWGIQDAVAVAANYIKERQPGIKVLGVEPPFLPYDAANGLRELLPQVHLHDAQRSLELLRAIKSPRELDLIEKASGRVVDSMVAVMTSHGPGATKRQLVDALIAEETQRGLGFEYCLVTAGKSMNRAPSDYVIQKGDIVSLDSGGECGGYIGDLCRMCVMGEPDAQLQDLLAEVDAIQMAARSAIKRGNPGGDIYAAATKQIAISPHAKLVDFVAHGLGLVTHETPRLAPPGVFPYDAADAGAPLQAGMVISVETAIKHPQIGFIKLEDTIAIEASGARAYGDWGRGWTRGKA